MVSFDSLIECVLSTDEWLTNCTPGEPEYRVMASDLVIEGFEGHGVMGDMVVDEADVMAVFEVVIVLAGGEAGG